MLLPFFVWLRVRPRQLAGRWRRAPRFAIRKNAGHKFQVCDRVWYKNKLDLTPETLTVVVDRISHFLMPILQGLNKSHPIHLKWTPSQGWSE